MTDRQVAARGAEGDADLGTWRAGDTERLVRHLGRAGQTVAAAESLTGGLVVAALTDVPGASAVVRGGAVVYHSDLKADIVGVDAGVLASGGPVQGAVAAQLASGAARLFGATWGVGTTGVAGPGPADGHPEGTVFVAVHGPGGVVVRALHLSGDRHRVRADTVTAVLGLLARVSGMA